MIGGAFVTGTDTGVGKTLVSAALLRVLGSNGERSAGLKPVAAGQERIDGVLVNEDVALLRAHGTLPLRDDEVGPCQLATPCAPHIAAALEGVRIDRDRLLMSARDLASRADWLVVEGVGGFKVPLTAGFDTADLAVEIGLPVVLVVGLRLGCLNHALLTAEAIAARGLRLAGWVANRIDPDMPHQDANIATLRDALRAPCLADVPWLASRDVRAVASHIDAASVRAALACSPARLLR